MFPTLSKGATGQSVLALQDVLNHHIRRADFLKVDGVFGAKTDARVRMFQSSNKLVADGVVGPLTNAVLFEDTEVRVPVFFIPNLQLNKPRFGQSGPFGIQPPRLIPQLQWPGPPFPAPPPFQFGGLFRLSPSSSGALPTFTGPANALGLKFTVPTRNDPDDPSVRSRTTILELINDLPVNSKFKSFLGSQVPSTIQKISPPGTGFQWGAAPLFDPIDPKGFGVKGNARFTLRISEGAGGLPSIVMGAWGEGKMTLDFESKQGQARPRLQAEGQVFFGFEGVF